MRRPAPSLQARALGWLAQREHSCIELRRKLRRHADAQQPDAAEQIERLLAALQAEGLLSEQRFIESRVRARALGHGARRIEHELARHGLKLPAAQQQGLRDSELQRAAELWRRRFGAAASDPRERARQARFLAGRGFSGEVIRRVLAHAGALPDDDAVDPA